MYITMLKPIEYLRSLALTAEIVEFEQQAGELLGECMDIFTSVQAELQLIKEGMDDAEEQAMEVKKKRMLNSLYGLMSSLKVSTVLVNEKRSNIQLDHAVF